LNEAETRVLARAADQYGVVGRQQARASGMTDRQIDTRIASERWQVVHPGVYRVDGAPATTRQRLMAATLRAGDDSAISHRAGGRLLRLDAVAKPAVIDISVTSAHRLRADGINVHRTTLERVDRVTVDNIACTSATRTIIDLAGQLDDEALETAFDSARRLGLTAPGALARRAAALCGRGRPGSTRVAKLLRVLEARPLESKLEVRVARLLRRHGLRPPANQLVVGRYRIDFAWPALLLGLECDGFEHHGRRLVWKQDRRRIAALEAAGWRLVHVTWDDVARHPDETVARLRRAVQRVA
jgi:very-short-patch-repair endonuclease